MFKKVNTIYFVKETKDLYGIESEDGKRAIVHSSYADDKISVSTEDYIYPLPNVCFERLVEEVNLLGFNVRIQEGTFNLEHLIITNFVKTDWRQDDTADQCILVKGGNHNKWELWNSYNCYWKIPSVCYLEFTGENEDEVISTLNKEGVTIEDLEKVYCRLGWI